MDQELINEYEKLYGKKPHHKMTEKSVQLKIEEATRPKQEEPETTVIADVISSEEMPLSRGRGLSTEYLVTFNDSERFWTGNSIRAMKSYFVSGQAKLPEGSPYEGAEQLKRCSNC